MDVDEGIDEGVDKGVSDKLQPKEKVPPSSDENTSTIKAWDKIGLKQCQTTKNTTK